MKKLLLALCLLGSSNAHAISKYMTYANGRNAALGSALALAAGAGASHYAKYHPLDQLRRRMARQLILNKFIDQQARFRHLRKMKRLNANTRWWAHARNAMGVGAAGMTALSGYAAHKHAMEKLRAELSK